MITWNEVVSQEGKGNFSVFLREEMIKCLLSPENRENFGRGEDVSACRVRKKGPERGGERRGHLDL